MKTKKALSIVIELAEERLEAIEEILLDKNGKIYGCKNINQIHEAIKLVKTIQKELTCQKK